MPLLFVFVHKAEDGLKRDLGAGRAREIIAPMHSPRKLQEFMGYTRLLQLLSQTSALQHPDQGIARAMQHQRGR